MANPGTKINAATALNSIDPYIPDQLHHIFTFSDGYKIVFFAGSDGAYYVIRTAAGSWQNPVKWSSDTGIFTAARPTRIGQKGTTDTLAAFYHDGNTPPRLKQTIFPWNASTHVMGTIVTTLSLTLVFNSQAAYNSQWASWLDITVQWDTTQSVWHVVIAVVSTAGYTSVVVVVVTDGTVSTAPPLQWKQDSMWYYSSSSNISHLNCILSSDNLTLHITVADVGRAALYNLPLSIRTGGFNTWQTSRGERILPSATAHSVRLDSSGFVDIVVLQEPGGGSASVYHIKRTGTNIFAAPIALQSGGLTTGATRSHPVTCYDTHTGDLYAFWVSTQNQPHGELYVSKRHSGIWATPQLIAGGDSSGYVHPTTGGNFDSSSGTNNTADVVYVNGYTGGSAPNLYWFPSAPFSAPNTPSQLLPTGNNVSVTPSLSWTYSNASPNDAQNAYEIKVTRVSDSVVMWDSGKVSLQASFDATGAASGQKNVTVATGAGAQFQPGQQCLFGLGNQEVVQVSSVAGDVVTMVNNLTNTHAINDPLSTYASLATAKLYGQLSNTTDGNYVAASGLAYGTGYQYQVRTWDLLGNLPSAYSSAVLYTGYHAPAPSITQVVSNAQTFTNPAAANSIGAPVCDVTWTQTQTEGNTAVSYQLLLYAADQATVINSTAVTSCSVASGGTLGAPDFNVISGATQTVVNGNTYYLAVQTTDSAGLVATSPLFEVVANWVAPPAPLNVTATTDKNEGEVDLAWITLSDNFLPNGDFELGTTSPTSWTSTTGGTGATSYTTDVLEPGTTEKIVTVNASGTNNAYWTATTEALTPNSILTYTFSIWAKGANFQAKLLWFDISSSLLRTDTLSLTGPASWSQVQSWVTAPANANTCQIRVGHQGSTNGAVSLDKAMLETGITASPYRNQGVGVVTAVTVAYSPAGQNAWTTLQSGTLRQSLTVLPKLLTAYDYQVSTVSSLGVPSTAAIVPNVALGLLANKYGIVLTDTVTPSLRLFLGITLQDFESATNWEHQEDTVSWVPQGRKKPVRIYGLADWWSAPSRKFFVPAADPDQNVQSGQAALANGTTMNQTHDPLLYRDATGRYIFCTIENFKTYVEDGINYGVQLDYGELDTSQSLPQYPAFFVF